MNSFSYIFIASVVLMAITRIWLARRQINNVDRNKNAVPTAFENDIPLAEHQKAAAYTVAKTKLSIIVVLYEAAILFALTFGGAINLTYESISAMELTPILEGLVFLGALGLALTLIEIPLGLYKTFVLEEKFGFNKMTLGLFVRDTVLGLVIGAIFGAILIGIILWLMQTSGPNWWILAWGVAIVFWLFIQFISPTLIAPLFNKFSPLEDEQLKIRIENLLRKCGFASKGLFVMDGSKRSSHGNAYFTGFGKNKRIVFFDTLIEKHQPEEVEAVLAHELGHFKLKHVTKLTVMMAIFGFIFFWALGMSQKNPELFTGINVLHNEVDAVVLATFYFVVPVFLFFIRPALASYLRKNEFEADAYAASHAPSKDLIKALVRLYKDNSSTLTPDAIYSAFYDSHPPAGARIRRLQQI